MRIQSIIKFVNIVSTKICINHSIFWAHFLDDTRIDISMTVQVERLVAMETLIMAA
jgi:hypothetical protein